MLGKDIPRRHSLLLIDRSPSRYLVALVGIERAAVIELQVGNPAPDVFRGRTGISEAADANHITALLIIGISIEEIIADVFQDILDLAAGHALDIGFGIGNGGLGQHVFHCHRLARQYAGTPAEARRQRNLGIQFAAQRVADPLIHGAAEITAAIEQAVRRRDLLGIGRRMRLAPFLYYAPPPRRPLSP